MWSGNELRQSFLDYFEGKGHLRMPSASLIPDDPTVLLTIAGMVPFKPYFMGKAVPPSTRMTSSQKCVRTNDLDNVGRTARHHTFFEMLGNFSVGDYFKEGVIPWAWEYLTQNLSISPDKLWVSVYQDDDDAYKIWNQGVGISQSRIVRMGKEDNFWEMGATGPCGPCSEIYYDFGPEKGCGRPDCAVGCDCDRYLEIWNLVFMEFDRDASGKLTPLPQQNIDTGMGLERIASVMQNTKTNFETDLLRPLIGRMEDISQKGYGLGNSADDMAFRVIADHLRSIVFLIADGVLPGNEGRGYVLRRVMRRAMRYGKLLGVDEAFMGKIGEKCSEVMLGAYPELAARQDRIIRVIGAEEERFNGTLHTGLMILQEMAERSKSMKSSLINGQDAFKLYDTYGFPLEMTVELAQEQGLTVDIDGFSAEMQGQKERARAAREIAGKGSFGVVIDKTIPATVFCGRGQLLGTGQIVAIVSDENTLEIAETGARVGVVIDETPFYAESGGQVGDSGSIMWEGGSAVVLDTRKMAGERFLHQIEIKEGELLLGTKVSLQVDMERRKSIAAAHTSTHLLHYALRAVLGQHVHQAGSLVQAGTLRFDFTHFEAITRDQLDQIEAMVNKLIADDLLVETKEMDIESAKKSGAMALFDEKYGETVRVVSMGDISVELCGGTHLERTGQAGIFKIAGEGSVGAGIRRIEAEIGLTAYNSYKRSERIMQSLCARLKAKDDDVIERLEQFLGQSRQVEKELQQLKAKQAGSQAQDILSLRKDICGYQFLATELGTADMDAMRITMDGLKDKTDILVLAGRDNAKANLLAACSKNAIEKGIKAGDIIKNIAKEIGGGGGGRPDMAQAGGKNPAGVEAALLAAEEVVRKMIGGC